ncbi:hypothetical protein UFOVP1165_36 [uncultured Caudovirales phage]|uniref:Uncharacterized protein n=1 Tax=uncultured Caudovirales phage TaxID=2100421 RepID=A0A6J5QUC6_9CAUD|nr:hypothetical protein UFOVP1165_36 [uncultured Caudovirales phage]
MKYHPELAKEVVRLTGGRYEANDVHNILLALESTDEQKALRANDARYQWLRDPANYPRNGYRSGEALKTLEALDQAIDKARES